MPRYYFGPSISGAEQAKENAMRFFTQTQLANRAFDAQENARANAMALQQAQLARQDQARRLQQQQQARALALGLARMGATQDFQRAKLGQLREYGLGKQEAAEGLQQSRLDQARYFKGLDIGQQELNRVQKERLLGGKEANREAQQFFRRLISDKGIKNLPELTLALQPYPNLSESQKMEALRELKERQELAKDFRDQTALEAANYEAALKSGTDFEVVVREIASTRNNRVVADRVRKTVIPRPSQADKYGTDAIEYFRTNQMSLPTPSIAAPATTFTPPPSSIFGPSGGRIPPAQIDEGEEDLLDSLFEEE